MFYNNNGTQSDDDRSPKGSVDNRDDDATPTTTAKAVRVVGGLSRTMGFLITTRIVVHVQYYTDRDAFLHDDVVIVCYYIVSTSNRLPCTWRRVVWQRDNACGKQHCKRGVANPVWSGLGVTEQRVTVAIIRTQRGRLVVPIPTTGGFVVSATATVSYL